MFNVVKLLVFI